MVKNTKMLLAEIKSEGKRPNKILLIDILPTSGPRWHQKVLEHLDNALIEALEHQREQKYGLSYFKRLLLAGASPNARDGINQTALHHSVEARNSGICALLLENGAKPNAKDNVGLTPLHNAVYHDKTKICKLLVENGADVDAKDNNGETPLEMAKRHKRTEILKVLRAARAKKAGST